MNLASFLAYCFIVNITPGPANAVIVSAVNNESTKAGAQYAAGVSCSFGLLMVISAWFSQSLYHLMPSVLPVFKLVGAAYMLYMAYGIFKSGPHKEKAMTYGFKSGALMTFINPKIVIYTLTVLPAFVTPYYPQGPILWLYVIIIVSMGSLTLFIWLFFGTLLQRGFHKYKQVINYLLAGFMVYSAILVAV